MGAYESIKNEKAKVSPSFFFVVLLSLSLKVVAMEFNYLISKANAVIL